jgi:hypothetical protein
MTATTTARAFHFSEAIVIVEAKRLRGQAQQADKREFLLELLREKEGPVLLKGVHLRLLTLFGVRLGELPRLLRPHYTVTASPSGLWCLPEEGGPAE